MLWLWTGFIGFILLMLALDLGVFHRNAHAVSMREAIAWSTVWVCLGLAFSGFVYFGYGGHWLELGTHIDAVDGLANDGRSATEKYLTGYVVEKSLSVDNIFVIAMIFHTFAIPSMYQHRVLFWGILGALVLRGLMIAAGTAFIAKFHWVLDVFAAFLIVTAVKMLFLNKENNDLNRNPAVWLARRLFPVTSHCHGEHFFVRAGSPASCEREVPDADCLADEAVARAAPGTLMMTPLALALLVVEATDLIFAGDSLPAIFAITADPFLVFTSNVFAILGLRSLYFALAGMLDKFCYLKFSLALILLVVGLKMFFADRLKVLLGSHFNFYLLGVVLLILATGIVASLLRSKSGRQNRARESRVIGQGLSDGRRWKSGKSGPA